MNVSILALPEFFLYIVTVNTMKGFPMKQHIVFLILIVAGCFMAFTVQTDEQKFQAFIDHHVATVAPLLKAMNLASWNASATGEKRYYDEQAALEMKIRSLYASKEDFALLKQWKEAGTITDPLLRRQLTILYNSYLVNQIDTALMRKIVEKSTAIANTFNVFRATLDGKEVSDNEIQEILRTEKNSAVRKKAWEASKQVGKAVAADVLGLVKLRNEAARQLGFKNYYEMMLIASEQSEEEIMNIFDELDRLTAEPFRKLKAEIDEKLAERWGISVAEMRPWHYQDRFFQEAPQISSVDFDLFFKGKNVDELARKFYASIGLPVEDILQRSDLYERKGKYQHAFETDIDREGDVRVMLSIKDNEYWMSTMLHELGHGVYSKYIDKTLPFLLRTEAHIFLTEAIAQLMERQAQNGDWLQTMVGISDAQKEEVRKVTHQNLRMKELVFARWTQVMVRFERAMYENPDQDLNALWWQLVQRYQLVTPPEDRYEPDWAAKIHLAQVPVYYHNYQLGELAASQLQHMLVTKVLKTNEQTPSYYNRPEVGRYLRENVFAPGARLRWDELVRSATGEPLTAKYFAQEFVQ